MRRPIGYRSLQFLVPCYRRSRALLRPLDDLRQALEALSLDVADAKLRPPMSRRVEEWR
jgi:hypothetical protein